MGRAVPVAAQARTQAPPTIDASGWSAHLKLGFTQDGKGRSVLTERAHAGPLRKLFIRIWSVLRPALTGSNAVAPRLWAT